MRGVCTSAGLAALLAGCSGGGAITPESLAYANLSAELRRAYAASYLDQPFADGPVSVVAEERGEMKTFILVPCRGGDHVCAGGLHGPAGHRTDAPDFVSVQWIYGGRVFLLEPGGGGVLRHAGRDTPLAWD